MGVSPATDKSPDCKAAQRVHDNLYCQDGALLPILGGGRSVEPLACLSYGVVQQLRAVDVVGLSKQHAHGDL